MNHWITLSLKRQYVNNDSAEYKYWILYNVFFFLGIHASYPLPDFNEVLCSNPLQIDLKKLKSFLQKCPENYEVKWYFG